MPILDRVLTIELLKTLFLVVGVLLILVLSNALVLLLGDVAAGALGLKTMGGLLLVQLVKLSAFILPPAFFFSILWVLGRMYRDSEIIALQAAGIGQWRLYRPFVVLSIPLALLVSVLVFWLYPEAKAYSDWLQQKERGRLELSGFKAGRFNEFRQGGFVAYVDAVDEQHDELKRVFVHYRQPSGSGIVVAERANVEWVEALQGRFLILHRGYRYQGLPGVDSFSSGRFDRYALRLPESQAEEAELSRAALPTVLLWRADSSALKLKAEFQRRLAAPLSLFALMLMSLPLAKSLPRQGMYGRLLSAVILYALFLNLVQLAVKWMAKGYTPAWLGAWWVPALASVLALLIAYFNSIAFASVWRRFWQKFQ